MSEIAALVLFDPELFILFAIKTQLKVTLYVVYSADFFSVFSKRVSRLESRALNLRGDYFQPRKKVY